VLCCSWTKKKNAILCFVFVLFFLLSTDFDLFMGGLWSNTVGKIDVIGFTKGSHRDDGILSERMRI